MRKFVILLLLLFVGNFIFAKVYFNPWKVDARFYPKHVVDENDILLNGEIKSSPIPQYSARTNFTAVLIDSSKNGYGLYSNNTNPLVRVDGVGFMAVYRQWFGLNNSAGYIGAARSTDGINWEIESGLNTIYPGGSEPNTADGQPEGRYPNAAGSANSYPTAVWNEYTISTGGGESGGRAMYTWDEFGWVGQSYASPIFDLNTGCQTFPCNPPDLWVGQTQIFENLNGDIILLSIFNESLGANRYWLLRNDYELFGYLGMHSPILILDSINEGFYYETGSRYTGTPEFHINDNGIGYLVASSYWADYNNNGPVRNHTFFYKQSTDFGTTWTSSGGIDGTGYFYLPDNILNQLMYDTGLLGDSLFIEVDTNGDSVFQEFNEAFVGYDYDVKVDTDGGLHILSVVVPTFYGADGVYPGISGAGHYHFYNPTPEDQNTWSVTLVRDMSVSFWFDYGEFNGWQYLYPDLALGTNNVLWAVTSAVNDTVWQGDDVTFNDIDIFASKSEDNGATWTDLGNMTNTPSDDILQYWELSPHIAASATDTSCYLIYQVPDYAVETISPASNNEDYKQWLFIGRIGTGQPVNSIDNPQIAVDFSLNQNYPNPFNPTTRISYSIAKKSLVTIDLYDIRGVKIKTLVNEKKPVGSYSVELDASLLASGLYFYTLHYEGKTKTRKLVLLK